MFSCKFSVPLMQPVATIPTFSSLSFFEDGWPGLNIMQKMSHHLKHLLLFFFQSVTWLIHNILWLTRGSGLSSYLIISNLMNPVLKEKVLIASHCYQDFASASIQFHPVSTVVAFKTILCDTVILSYQWCIFLLSADFPCTWASFFRI